MDGLCVRNDICVQGVNNEMPADRVKKKSCLSRLYLGKIRSKKIID